MLLYLQVCGDAKGIVTTGKAAVSMSVIPAASAADTGFRQSPTVWAIGHGGELNVADGHRDQQFSVTDRSTVQHNLSSRSDSDGFVNASPVIRRVCQRFAGHNKNWCIV
jgi:hypothetical protein